MKTYRVRCGFRPDGHLLSAVTASTHWDIVTVTVPDRENPIPAAIYAMYAKHGLRCAHVRPETFQEVQS